MLRVLITITLLLSAGAGHVCAAEAACAWNGNAVCHLNDAHHDSGSHSATHCQMGSCRYHGEGFLTLSNTPQSRIEHTPSNKAGAFLAYSSLCPTAVPSGFSRKASLVLQHPSPAPPTYLLNCIFLC